MNIYVGNLAHAVTEEELRQAFEVFGEVAEARLIIDKFSGKSKGFGFVEMPSKEEAEKAIEEMNGKELKERPISVNEAKPKTDRSSGGRGGRGGSGGGGYGGNRGGSGGNRGGSGGGDRY